MDTPELPWTALTQGRNISFNPKYVNDPAQAAMIWLHEWRHVQQNIWQGWLVPPYTTEGGLMLHQRLEMDAYIYALRWSVHISPEANRYTVDWYNGYMLGLLAAQIDLQSLWQIKILSD